MSFQVDSKRGKEIDKNKPVPVLPTVDILENLRPWSAKPTVAKPGPGFYTKIHVCQASYGDCLALEIDPTPPEEPDKNGSGFHLKVKKYQKDRIESHTRSVILIDGGPAKIIPSGANMWITLPINNLYDMLNTLLPPQGQKLDTLVVTHDDADHMLGIKQLLQALNNAQDTGNTFWNRGALAMVESKAPFANIWHNSAQNVLVACHGRGYMGRNYEGYFDKELRIMKERLKNSAFLPTFNQEFGTTPDKPYMITTGTNTFRGHVSFQFLGPLLSQVRELATFYQTKGPTKGGSDSLVHQMTDLSGDVSDKWEHMTENLTKNPTNDTSKKNLSSLVFTAAGPLDENRDFKALFMGDASAHSIFGDGPLWDGVPIDLDVMKVTHHGSCHNNFFGRAAANKVKQQADAFYPNSDKWNQMLPARLKGNAPDASALTNIITYFSNIRAHRYIISASHDCHPNPHMSTLVGIIARAIMFHQDSRPVEIYMTNPIFGETWRQLIGFWINADHLNIPDPTATWQRPSLLVNNWDEKWTEDFATIIRMANAPQHTGMTASNMSEAALADLHYDYDGKYYLFYQLRPDASFGTVYLTQPQLWDPWSWIRVAPFSNWCRHYLSQHYNMNVLGEPIKDLKSLRVPSKAQKVAKKITKKTLKRDKGQDLKIWKAISGKKTLPKTQSKRRKRDAPMVGSNSKRVRGPAKRVGRGGNANMMVSTSHMLMTNFMVMDGSNGSNGSTDGPINRRHLEAISLVTSSQAPPAQTGNPASKDKQEPLRPDWKVFRKFDVDVFDIPQGDLFGDDVKLKRLDCIDDLLYHLVVGDDLSLEHATLFHQNGFGEHLPLLGPLTNMLLGPDDANHVLKLLPVNFPKTWDEMNAPNSAGNPLLWPVQDFDAVVLDIEEMSYSISGSSGIQQVSMTLAPPGVEVMEWNVPNQANLLGNGTMKIHVFNGIDLIIYWPTDPKRRIVYGTFTGSVQTRANKPENPLVCEFLVLPDETRPVEYVVQFADQNFNTEGYRMNIIDMLAAFGGVTVDLAAAAADIVLPGFDSNNILPGDLIFTEPGFVLSLDSTYGVDLRLHKVFGTFSIQNFEPWKPFKGSAGKKGSKVENFLLKLSIGTPRVQLMLSDLFDADGPSFFFRINHSFVFDEVELAYEIQTRPNRRGGKIYEFTFTPEDTEKKALTLTKLLETLSMSTLSKDDLPSFVGQITDGVSLNCFRLGWYGKLGMPDYIEIALQVDMEIISDILEIDAAMLRLRIDSPANSKKRNIYLQGCGLTSVVDTDMMISFAYGNDPIMQTGHGEGGSVDLELHCLNTPLTLGSILGHYFPNTTFLPSPFDTVVQEVGLTSFKFQTANDANGKTVVLLARVELGIKSTKIDILDGLSMVYPSLAITCILPFDKTDKRTFALMFDSTIQIDGYNLNVDVGMISAKQSQYSVALRPGSEGFPVGAFVGWCTKKVNHSLHLDLPTDFKTLNETYLDSFAITVSNKQGKWGVQDVSFSASSNLQLELWKEPKVVLDNIALAANYKSGTDLNIQFTAMLTISDRKFTTTVRYGVLNDLAARTESEDGQQKPAGGSVGTVTTPHSTQRGFLVELTHNGEISLFDIAMKLANVDLKDGLGKTEMEKLKKKVDIKIKNLSLKLQQDPAFGSVWVGADVKGTDFKRVDFAATLMGTTWGFMLALSLHDDLLSFMPDVIAEASKYLKIDNTSIALYVGQVNPTQAGVKNKVPPQSRSARSASQIRVAMTTTLKLTKEFGALSNWITEWIGASQIDVAGEISTSSLKLAVGLGNFRFLKQADGKYTFTVDGNFFFEANSSVLSIGLGANMKIWLPIITTDEIVVDDAALTLELKTLGLGLKGGIDGPLTKLFGIDGFEAYGLEITGVFSAVQSLVPSVLGMSGGVRFAGAGDLSGKIAFWFAESDPFSCYLMADFENLNVQTILNYLLKNRGIPPIAGQLLQGCNVVLNKLAIKVAAEDVRNPRLNETIHQGIYFESNVFFKVQNRQWSGYCLAEFNTTPRLRWIVMMSPVHFGSGSETFFSLTRKEHLDDDPIKDPVIPSPTKKNQAIDLQMLTLGPVIYISCVEGEIPFFISVKITLLGFYSHLRAIGKDDRFTADFKANAGPANIQANIELYLKQRVQVSASLNLPLDPTTIPQLILQQVDKRVTLPSLNIANAWARADVHLDVSWPGGNAGFDISLTASVSALNKQWPLPQISANASMSAEDFDQVSKIAQMILREFEKQFRGLVQDFIRSTGLDKAVDFINDAWNVGTSDLVRALSIIRNDPNVVGIVNTVRQQLNIGIDQIAQTLKDLDVAINEALVTISDGLLRIIQLMTVLPGPFQPVQPIINIPFLTDIKFPWGDIHIPPLFSFASVERLTATQQMLEPEALAAPQVIPGMGLMANITGSQIATQDAVESAPAVAADTKVAMVGISDEDTIAIISALRKAGYPAEDVYSALVQMFDASSGDDVRQFMVQSGFTDEDVTRVA